MRIDFDDSDLRPLIERVVAETLSQAQADDAKLGGRLAFPESEAALLLGVEKYTLRDCRRRGEIAGCMIGKKICYSTDELREFLRRQQQ